MIREGKAPLTVGWVDKGGCGALMLEIPPVPYLFIFSIESIFMKIVTEGEAKICVPSESLTKRSEAFYNPRMEHQRDVTIAILQLTKPKEALDPLAATGVRGIRILLEVPTIQKVVFNDANPNAVKLIEKNLEVNCIKKSRYEIYNKDANLLFLEKRKYDFVDIDPFGSPVRYLRNVGFTLHKDSIIGVTATDSGALSGKFAKACFRRYGVFVEQTDFAKELGVRVLITSILQNLAIHNMTFKPLYSHANHYFRVVGQIEYGPDKNLSKIQMVSYCSNCHNKKIGIEKTCDNCESRMKILGPLWTGKIQDRAFVQKMLLKFARKKEIEICSQEVDHPFYYDLHHLSKFLKTSSPKIENVIETLRKHGFAASRTHLCATGVKTNAEIRDILKIFK